MNIPQLETFLWIARLGSITEACSRLHVTQSTLSMRLKALETDLGVQLFDRTHKHLTLTPKGRDLLNHAEKVMDAVHQLRLYVADPESLSGTIRIGIAELIALTWGPELIRQIDARYPKIHLDLDVGVPRPLTDALTNGTLDVALAPTLTTPEAPFPTLALGSVDFSWMGSPESPLADQVLTPGALQHTNIIGVAKTDSVIHWAMQQWFTENDAVIQDLITCNSITTSAAMVMAGVGVALLPDICCTTFIEQGRMLRLRATRRFGLNFYALCSPLGDQSVSIEVARLAQSISNFSDRSIDSLSDEGQPATH